MLLPINKTLMPNRRVLTNIRVVLKCEFAKKTLAYVTKMKNSLNSFLPWMAFNFNKGKGKS